MTPPFERTHCSCDACRACCQRPGHLIPSDLPRLIERLGGAPVHQWLGASPGARMLMIPKGQSLTLLSLADAVANLDAAVVVQIPTITPRTLETTRRCVFQDDQERCTIHDIAPFGCAYFDMHMDRTTGNDRSIWGIRQILDDPGSYQGLRSTLDQEDTHA